VRPFPNGDWCVKQEVAPWASAAQSPGEHGFLENMQVRFSLGGDVGATGHVFIFVETRGINRDMRTQQGLQAAPKNPAIGLVLVPGVDAGATLSSLPANAVNSLPEARDGVWQEAFLLVDGLDTEHIVIPYLGPGETAEGLQLVVTVYSDVPMGRPGTAGGRGGEDWEKCWCEKCNGKKSPFQHVIEKMEKLEMIMDQRITFLDGLISAA